MPSKRQRRIKATAEHIEQASNLLKEIADEVPEWREVRLRWLDEARRLALLWAEDEA